MLGATGPLVFDETGSVAADFSSIDRLMVCSCESAVSTLLGFVELDGLVVSPSAGICLVVTTCVTDFEKNFSSCYNICQQLSARSVVHSFIVGRVRHPRLHKTFHVSRRDTKMESLTAPSIVTCFENFDRISSGTLSK